MLSALGRMKPKSRQLVRRKLSTSESQLPTSYYQCPQTQNGPNFESNFPTQALVCLDLPHLRFMGGNHGVVFVHLTWLPSSKTFIDRIYSILQCYF